MLGSTHFPKGKYYNTCLQLFVLLISLLIVNINVYSSFSISESFFLKKIETSPLFELLDPQSEQLSGIPPIKNHQEIVLTNKTLEKSKINVFINEGAFQAFNLFILKRKHQDTPPIADFYLIVTDMEGMILSKKEFGTYDYGGALGAEFINSTTILMAKPDGAALWNIYTNKTTHLNIHGHHEFEYNPINNTIFTLTSKRIEINGILYVFDIISEFDITGNLVWTMDTNSFISHTQWCPFLDTGKNGSADVVHGNSIFFAEEKNFYFNSRNVNTFYKINYETGQVIWGLGEYGNFTLFNRLGNQCDNLFFHAHAVEKIDNNTFILFDNDLHNQTNPNNQRSRILEITINETTMTANESWSWTAPRDYYSLALGDADRLPNGNRLGVFGYDIHPNTSIGARLVEVNETGQIVWEINFPNNEDYRYNIYRMERFRFTPILNAPPDFQTSTNENITVEWQTWYNYRPKWHRNGSYRLYLEDVPIKSGMHVFDKFWRPTNLTFTLGRLILGNHNLTLTVVDEDGHVTRDSLIISVISFDQDCEFPSFFLIPSSFLVLLGGINIIMIWKQRHKRRKES
ncbi:MAG: aryl-sulfate sulfotransferase [Candidatus Hodarchaeota archaeon]